MRQVGYLQELYGDAQQTEHKIARFYGCTLKLVKQYQVILKYIKYKNWKRKCYCLLGSNAVVLYLVTNSSEQRNESTVRQGIRKARHREGKE